MRTTPKSTQTAGPALPHLFRMDAPDAGTFCTTPAQLLLQRAAGEIFDPMRMREQLHDVQLELLLFQIADDTIPEDGYYYRDLFTALNTLLTALVKGRLFALDSPYTRHEKATLQAEIDKAREHAVCHYNQQQRAQRKKKGGSSKAIS